MLVQYSLGVSCLEWGWGQPCGDVGSPGGDSHSLGTAWHLFLRLDLSVPGPRDATWTKGKVLLLLVHCVGVTWLGGLGSPPGWAGGAVAASRGLCQQLCSKWPVTCLMGCVNKHVCLGPLALADDPAAGL